MNDDRGNPYLAASSLDELLSWNDVDFVRCAYATVLGRQPDEVGENHFTHHIRSGASKLDVLWRLRKSVEGSLHDPGIAGFDHALNRAARQRERIWGAVARLFGSDVDGNSRTDRALRALNNLASVNQEHLRSIDQKLGMLTDAVSSPAIGHPSVGGPSSAAGARAAAVNLPELSHLRIEAPLARHFRDHPR